MALSRGRGRGRLVLDERDRRILALAVPALFTLAVEPLYLLVDTAIVGRLGTAPLGGLAIATSVLTTLLWVCNFLSFGTTTRVAVLTGRGDHRAAATAGAQALWLCGFIGVPLAVLVLVAARPLATALGGEGAVLGAAVTYLRISAAAMPAVLIALAAQGYLRGLSDTRSPLRVVLVANLVNVVLEVVLVYGFDLGVAGSAWGTLVAQLLAAGWFLRICGARIIGTGARLRPVAAELRRLIAVGRHVFVRTAALLAVLTSATAVAARVGPATLAAHQIAYQVFVLLALVVDALAIAAQAIIGTELGAGGGEATATARRLIRLGLVVGAGIAVVLIALAPFAPHLFTADGAVASRAAVALVLLGVMQLPGSVTFVLDGVLMGGNDFAYVKWVTVGALVVFVPFAAAVLTWHRLGIAGVWAGLLAWMTARAALNWARFRSGRWTAAAG
jgi:putative MATE family efflux protein